MKIGLSTQPETYRQLIIRSLRLYQQIFLRVIPFSIVLSLIVFIPRLVLFFSNNSLESLPPLSLHRLWFILIELISLTLFTALLWRIRCIFLDKHELIQQDIKIALQKLPYIITATLLQSLLIILLNVIVFSFLFSLPSHIVLHTIPGEIITLFLIIFSQLLVIYLFFAFYFYLPVILIENEGILNSLKKSFALVWGNWWRTVKLQITPWFMYLLVIIVLKKATMLPLHIYFFDSSTPSTLFSIFFHVIILALFVPWVASTLLIQLRDLELRQYQVKQLSPLT